MRRLMWCGVLAAIALTAVLVAAPYARAARMLVTLTNQPAWAADWFAADERGIVTRDIRIPTRHGPVDARMYRPRHAPVLRLIVFPGVHGGGVDEPRLATLSTRLAASGALVVSVPIPDLRAYRLAPGATDVIEDAARWMADSPDLAPAGRVGIVGVSFAGGLALVAAGRPGLRDRVTAVLSIGGHGDLARVVSYLCTGIRTDGRIVTPHDYGVAVLVLEAAPALVASEELPGFREVLVHFLDASSLAATDMPGAMALLDQARTRAETLPPTSRAILREVIARDVAALGTRLRPLADGIGRAPALSPERSPLTSAPVFLLHGAGDSVIPDTEARAIARAMAARPGGVVDSLVTPLISHADLTADASPRDAWALVRFWTRWLSLAAAAP